MADKTKIEWTDTTWNIINGCDVVSPGCTNCYAMRLAGTRLRNHPSRKGLTVETKAGPVWNGTVRFYEPWLDQPLRWNKHRRIFVCAHGDLFHKDVPEPVLDKIFGVMALASQHTFQVLTKRPERMREYLTRSESRMRIIQEAERLKPSSLWNGNVHEASVRLAIDGYLPNVWLGTSVEDQKRADERIPDLIETPAAVRWLSCEPLLGPLDLSEWLYCPNWSDDIPMDMTTGLRECCSACEYSGLTFNIGWVVAGGESGPGSRPMHPAWLEFLYKQCEETSIPFLFKQWGDWQADRIEKEDPRSLHYPPGHVLFKNVGKKAAGRNLYGVTHDGYPA